MSVFVTYCDGHHDAPPPKCPHFVNMLPSMVKGGFAGVSKVTVIEIKRLSWIIQMFPV